MHLPTYILAIFVLFALITSTNVQGQVSTTQTEEEQITTVINRYIIGTSYSFPDTLKAAFMPEAKMFLDKAGEPLFVMTIEQYAALVAKGEAGKFNGRTTNILSIDQFQGIAMAKLEVIIPSLQKRFVDMLLLKKLDNGWKIISKTAGSEQSKREGNKVLIVTSNAAHRAKAEFSTGNSFSEVSVAYFTYQQAGYHVDFVSPKGGAIPLAYINPYDSLHAAALYDTDFMYALSHTQKPTEVNPDEYDIILYTGGSAPIFDIPQNTDIQRIATHIYEQKKGVVAAVCHGTAGIVNIKTSDGKYLVAGKNVNGYPEAFENKESALYKHYPFVIEKEIEKRGGMFEYGEKAKAYQVTDGRLVTGQNFQSTKVLAQKSIEISRKLKNNEK
ncbi:MAG: nuclear transport factor 2 family protein [Thermonemataceae bacterium]